MTLEAWLLFCAAETLLCLIPGPAVLLVVSLGMTRSASAGTRAGLGILSANALYFAISATGLGAILLASWQVFFAIKWLGAAYLVWIGVGMWLRRADDLPQPETPRPGAGFRHGFVTQAANPKLLVFFGAILPQFVDPAAPLPFQMAVLGTSSIAIELVVLVGYARLAASGGQLLKSPTSRVWISRLGGALLIAAAARLVRWRPSIAASSLP